MHSMIKEHAEAADGRFRVFHVSEKKWRNDRFAGTKEQVQHHFFLLPQKETVLDSKEKGLFELAGSAITVGAALS
ncbi:MAG: hypothetical protein ACI3XJ_11625 [Oscillospiraceae bacterium]